MLPLLLAAGATAVGAGAYGAHAFKPDKPAFKEARLRRLRQHCRTQSAERAGRLCPTRGLPTRRSLLRAQVFDTANRYHLLHSGLLALAPAASARPHLVCARVLPPPLRPLPRDASRRCRVPQVGGLFAGGTLLFCGSCYAAAVAQDRALGKAAPVGGTLLIAAWLATALA